MYNDDHLISETYQWRFSVGARGHRPSKSCAGSLPKFLVGSIVISLSRCCLPNDEGPGLPKYFS